MTEITIERCREHVAKCEEKGKFDDKARAIQFLLAKLDGEHAKYKNGHTEDLTVEYCERWLSRWCDTPQKSIPFAVKALDYALGVLAYERDQHQTFIERLGGYIGGMVDSTKVIKDHYREHKRTNAFMYRLQSNRREQTFLKTEAEEQENDQEKEQA